MKKRGRKTAVGASCIESLEGRVLLSGAAREVSGTVFYDLNTNWVQDAGEAPVVGVTVFADLNQNKKVDDGEVSTTSDAEGHYSLMTDADRSSLAVVRPAGWVLVVNVSSDLTPNVRNFPMGPAPSITGTVFEDNDADGYNGATTPRAGVTVFLDRNDNGFLDDGEETAVSDAEGKYLFEDLDSGFGKVRAAPMEGWSQAQPVGTAVFTYRSKTINGTIFKDLNRNGARDEGEGGFNDVILSATWGKSYGDGSRIVVVADNPVVTYPKEKQTGTDQDGKFTIRDVPIFSDQIVIPIYDWHLTTPADDQSNDLVIGLAHPSDLTSDPQGTVRGIVFNDLNHNGTRDAGEPPIVGVQLQPGIDRWPNSFPTTTTDSNGAYEVKLNRGRYRLYVAGLEYANNAGSPEFSLFEGETENINIPVSYYSWITWKVAVEFHNHPPTPVGEMWCYLDRNNNAKRDANEPRIVGHVGDWQTTTTVAGAYTIRIEKLPNHTRLISGLPSGNAVLGAASENNDAIVLEAPLFRARATVFFDKNGNGRRDAFEPLLQNVGVLVDKNENGLKDSDEGRYTTDFAGKFAALVPYGATRLKLTIPGRYQRLGLFSRDYTIRVFNSKDGAQLIIGLRARKG